MSILAAVQTGFTPTGLRIVIAGLEKMGKTTLAAGAPNALLIPLEVGYAGVNVAKTPMLTELAHVNQVLDEIISAAQQGQFPYKTIILDTMTALERFIHDYVISTDPLSVRGGKNTITMDSAHGGYGKAYNIANEQFAKILEKLDLLAVNAGIHIVMTCHTFANVIVDPSAGEYTTWDLLLHSPKNMKTYGKREMLTQWADIIGFLHDPVFITKEEGSKMSRAVSQERGRLLGLSRTPSYVAGNRFKAQGEISLPAPPENGWNALAQAIYESTNHQIDLFNRS